MILATFGAMYGMGKLITWTDPESRRPYVCVMCKHRVHMPAHLLCHAHTPCALRTHPLPLLLLHTTHTHRLTSSLCLMKTSSSTLHASRGSDPNSA